MNLSELIQRDTRANQPDPGIVGRLYCVTDESNLIERDNGVAWEAYYVSQTIDQSICQGRLTLESGVPISSSSQSAKTTLYFTPFNGNKIALYDGSAWQLLSFTEKSLSLSGYTADKNYDIWAYISGGAVTLDSTIWTNNTTRATEITWQDGIYIKSGDATRRYLGTIRITASTGQCEDSPTKRFVYNYYNRVDRLVQRATASWNDSSDTNFQAWNNDATTTIEFVLGIGVAAHISMYLFPISGGPTYVDLQETLGSELNAVSTLVNGSYQYSSHSLAVQFNAGYTKRIVVTKGTTNWYQVKASTIISM